MRVRLPRATTTYVPSVCLCYRGYSRPLPPISPGMLATCTLSRSPKGLLDFIWSTNWINLTKTKRSNSVFRTPHFRALCF
jgi:hypothetical protein